MNVKMIKADGTLGRVWKAKNQAEARQRVLELLANGEAVSVQYGKRVYTPSQVYGQW